jgi:mannose-1-phosphate guanylyltransferase
MNALLLAAGFGTRLRPLTDTIPKCLVPIHGKPLLEIWFDLLFSQGLIEKAVVNTHYLAPAVEAHVRGSRWRDRVVLAHETELLGTGGTMLANREMLSDGPFLLAHADNLTNFDLGSFLDFHAHRPAKAQMSMLAFRTDTPRSCGILELDGEGLVVGFHEKVENPPGNLANAAVYILEQDVIQCAVSLAKPVVDLQTEVIPHFAGRIAAQETTAYFRDIGTLESLEKANRDFP